MSLLGVLTPVGGLGTLTVTVSPLLISRCPLSSPLDTCQGNNDPVSSVLPTVRHRINWNTNMSNYYFLLVFPPQFHSLSPVIGGVRSPADVRYCDTLLAASLPLFLFVSVRLVNVFCSPAR